MNMTSKEEEVLHRLDYLNLDTGVYQKRKSVDKKPLICFSENSFNHKFHSEDLQLNTISDITYHILHNQLALSQSQDIIFRNYLNIFQKQRHKIDNLIENVKVIQNSLDLSKFNKLLTKKDIEKLMEQIYKEPKKVEEFITKLEKSVNTLEQKVDRIEEKLSILESFENKLKLLTG